MRRNERSGRGGELVEPGSPRRRMQAQEPAARKAARPHNAMRVVKWATVARFGPWNDATAAKPRKAPASSRSKAAHIASGAVVQTARLAFFSWLAAAAAGGMSFGEVGPSIRSSFRMRAPPKRKEKTGGPNRAASLCAVALAKAQAASTVTTGDTQPASARRSGGPTDDRAHAGGGTRRHAASVPSMSGAAQRRPCQARRPAGRGVCSKARHRALRWARSGSDEPGAARTVTPPAARFLRYSERRASAARYARPRTCAIALPDLTA